MRKHSSDVFQTKYAFSVLVVIVYICLNYNIAYALNGCNCCCEWVLSSYKECNPYKGMSIVSSEDCPRYCDYINGKPTRCASTSEEDGTAWSSLKSCM
jgi:hypothetical protein